MATTPSSDPPAPVVEPLSNHEYDRLAESASSYQRATTDYMDTLRNVMDTVASVIDFYDPSGVFTSKRDSNTDANDAGHSPHTELAQPQERTQSLFTQDAGAPPSAPPGLGKQDVNACSKNLNVIQLAPRKQLRKS